MIGIFVALKFYTDPKNETRSISSVTKIIDGDTMELASGKKVRLIGIDAPEENKPLYSQSTNFLASLVEGKEVILISDSVNADQYGRLLRYVYVDGDFVNLVMVREGYAAVYLFGTSEKFSQDFLDAEKFAKDKGLGIWKFPELEKCLHIKKFNYNAKGDDTQNLNGEFVLFSNECGKPLDMTGWTVSDKSKNKFTFPEFSFDEGTEVTLFSGNGTNSITELFWEGEVPIWNNNGDELILQDADGNLVLSKSYVN